MVLELYGLGATMFYMPPKIQTLYQDGLSRDFWPSGVDSSSALSFQSGNRREGLAENTRSGVGVKCPNH